MDTTKTYVYNWSAFEATIRWSTIFDSWKWNVRSIHNDYTNFSSHIDVELDTLEYAENDMFREIETHIGSTPKRQINL